MPWLTDDQKSILDVVRSGHNVLISGQAGTGKTTLVKEIYKTLQNRGKNVKIVCSSGIAGTIYDDLGAYARASTVHSFYNLQTADLPWQSVVNRSIQNSTICGKILDLDCLIWDEISMSSRRILEITNQVHQALDRSEINLSFNGIQLVMVGEFLQLRPVPNRLDPGEFMFKSPVFNHVITHRYELKNVLRQDQDETEFVRCLQEVRNGVCTKETELFLKGLSRRLPQDVEDKATHIFFKKVSVQFFNRRKLDLLPGASQEFVATDEGDTDGISCERSIVLKPGCKVMLIWNVNDRLKNGSAGIHVGVNEDEEDKIVVHFEGVGNVSLKRETWQKRGKNGEIIGSRCQFPVMLRYAITCHKAQGQTLDALVLHCSKEFVPGLIYVALTRVKRSAHLQVLNFHPKQLAPPDKECVTVCNSHCTEFHEDLTCCRKKPLPQHNWTVSECQYEEVDHVDQDDAVEVSNVTKRVVQSYFERGDPHEEYYDLETVYAVMSDEENGFMRTPPAHFSVHQIVDGMKIEEPLSDYAEEKNRVLEELRNKDELETMGNIMWSRACKLIIEDSIMNADEVQISSQQWAQNSREYFMLLTESPEFMTDLKLLFNTQDLSPLQGDIGAGLMKKIYDAVAGEIAQRVREVQREAPIVLEVRAMPNEGLSKIRHVGAWAVAKVFHKKLKYIRTNMASKTKTTIKTVKNNLDMTNLLDDHIIANIAKLEDSSEHPETLKLTETRQYRSRGLMHIEDSAYDFFLDLEQFRVDNLNSTKLKEHKENLIDKTLGIALKNAQLITKWQSCFPSDSENVSDSHDENVRSLYSLIVKKYLKAGVGQYLRDFRLAYRIKKSNEHRKKVLERKATLEVNKAAVPYSELERDHTPGKVNSHHRLVAFLEKFGELSFVKVYTKPQLLMLCKAYGVMSSLTRATKVNIVKNLVPVMKSAQCMVNHYYLENYTSHVEIDNDNERIVLRIGRS